MNRVEFLFNRTFKKAFGSKSSRIIRKIRSLDSKQDDLIQMADILLACATNARFGLEPQSPAKSSLLEHYKRRQSSISVTRNKLPKIDIHEWVPPEQFKYPR